MRPVFFVLAMLVLASLACYSDSPLFPGELTATPPQPTPIPPATQSQFEVGDLALVPQPDNTNAFRLVLTRFPEAFSASDITNRLPEPCNANSLIEILYAGTAEGGNTFYLVDCNGAVGWAPETSLLGPIGILPDQRAIATEAGANETGQFKIDINEPPYDPNAPFRQQADCRVNDTVDVLEILGLVTGEVFYRISCANPVNPVAPNSGWVASEALFGPVRFQNGEAGLVPRELEAIELTESPESETVTATCQQDERVQITDTPVQRIGDELFYEMSCADGMGWANQRVLRGPVNFEADQLVMVTAPQIRRRLGDEDGVEEATETDTLADDVRTVPLTAAPEPFLVENQAGECRDGRLVMIEQLVAAQDDIYAQVTCNEDEGWLPTGNLFGPARFTVGDQVELGENALLGFNERGIYLSIEVFDIQGGSGGSSTIAGECGYAIGSNASVEAELLDAAYYRDSTGDVVGVFYRAACDDADGQRIEGWINQERID